MTYCGTTVSFFFFLSQKRNCKNFKVFSFLLLSQSEAFLAQRTSFGPAHSFFLPISLTLSLSLSLAHSCTHAYTHTHILSLSFCYPFSQALEIKSNVGHEGTFSLHGPARERARAPKGRLHHRRVVVVAVVVITRAPELHALDLTGKWIKIVGGEKDGLRINERLKEGEPILEFCFAGTNYYEVERLLF